MLRPLMLCLALAVPGLAAAQERSADPGIEAAISGQLQAFRDSDVEGARVDLDALQAMDRVCQSLYLLILRLVLLYPLDDLSLLSDALDALILLLYDCILQFA